MSGLLGHVVSLLTTQRENAATEALAYVLRSNAARAALAGYFEGVCGAPMFVSDVRTQVAVGQESRPDLVALDADGQVRAFVEAKFWAGLSDAQPVEYVRRLTSQRGALLLFLVPARRVESLTAELTRRAQVGRLELSTWTRKTSFSVARTDAGCALAVGSWSSLLAAIRVECARDGDTRALTDLSQLEGLVEEFERDGFIPLAPSELTDLEAPRRMMSLVDVVAKAVQAANSEGIVGFDGKREQSGKYSGGRYAGFGSTTVWIGVDMQVWTQLQLSPAWVFFYGESGMSIPDIRKALHRWAAKTPPELLSFGVARAAVPLHVPSGAEEATVVASLVAQLRDIGKALAQPVTP